MTFVIALVALIGHLALFIFAINRLHAAPLPHWLLKLIDANWYSLLFGLPAAAVLWFVVRPDSSIFPWQTLRPFALSYLTICAVSAIIALPVWVRHLLNSGSTWRLASNHTCHLNVKSELGFAPLGALSARLAMCLPRNQILDLHIHEKTVYLPRLSQDLDGLSIVHLSDLHFTGQLTKPFFQFVVEQANQLEADLVVITGDIIDKPRCKSWLAEILGRLKSRHGTFFVLGNHDLRIRDEIWIRSTLTGVGHTDLGGRWQMITVNEQPIILAGNEVPWFTPAASMKDAPGIRDLKRPLRIAVSHSPDQFEWAQSYDFDLMLAGHTHGGQIRFPLIGPVFSPSRFGLKYASGTFYENPTLMHVSRGISGTRQLRFNCPPELTKLILRSDTCVTRNAISFHDKT